MKSLKTITKVALEGMIPMTMNSRRNEHNIVRKILLSVVCFTFLGMLPLCAQQISAVLHRQGIVTVYSPSHFSDAFANAEQGDTIYLSEGIWNKDLEIVPRLTVIGSGMGTIITGNLTIKSVSNVASIISSVQGIDIRGNLIVDAPGSSTKVSQCRVGGYVSLQGVINNPISFDRCYFHQFYLAENAPDVQVVNCKIEQIFGDSKPEQALVKNCTIKLLDSSNTGYNGLARAMYTNCIIGGWSEGAQSGGQNDLMMINCLGNTDQSEEPWFQYYYRENCWFNTNFTVDDEVNCSLTKDQLTAAGYLGTDNTVVGCEGGVAPFTLTPAVPRITDHTISVDSSTKKLNVTLTIGN